MGQPAAQLRATHGIVKVEVRVAQTGPVAFAIGELAQDSVPPLHCDSRTLTRGTIRKADEREKLRQPFCDPFLRQLMESKGSQQRFDFALGK